MKFKQNLGIKIAAVIFSYIMAFILFLSVALVVVLGYYKFYFSTAQIVKEEVLTEMAGREAHYIENILDEEIGNENSYLENYYKDKNIFYEITYLESGEVVTNYNGQEYIASADCEYYTYEDIIIRQDENATYYDTIEHHTADIKLYVAKDMKKNDLFSVASSLVDIGFRLRYVLVFIAIGSLALFIFLLCFLYSAAGHTSNGEINRNRLIFIQFTPRAYTFPRGFLWNFLQI